MVHEWCLLYQRLSQGLPSQVHMLGGKKLGQCWRLRASVIQFLSRCLNQQPSLPICIEIWQFQALYQCILVGYWAYLLTANQKKVSYI